MGNTKVICTVTGPAESKAGGGAGGGGAGGDKDGAAVVVNISIAGFSGVDRKRRGGRGDKYDSFSSFSIDSAQIQVLHGTKIL